MPNEIYAELSNLCATQQHREKKWLSGLRSAVFGLKDDLEKEFGVKNEPYIDCHDGFNKIRYVDIVDINERRINSQLEGTIDNNGVSTVDIHIALDSGLASHVIWRFRINVRYSESGAQYAMVNKDGSSPIWLSGRAEFIGVLIQELIQELKFDPLNRYK
ncbi:hypothetical protein C1S99_10895 [Vibrio parahaemolyticus]|uniref:hypothetical protein n=1 Tax=Vibrio parahaemolyticus TaxID=670 RepID=UPI000532257D|nr:hypothetical protein [Vibrio parahaemolyticus]EJB8688772.1 hypothetical protein [Vibrio parahaemolyticus]KGT34860.1 hypothetical protein HC02_13050 [Vibrio parahaemolyticus]PMS42216.1 hypothetical protein C1T12_11380 [Vibrio parahaemolyticus]PMS62276.1 hypothetical protein C1S91_15625 [Vibrio parahaemolyticus]PMS68205.1 hypothetical protein C1S96_11810 [Vibrio parahaemolyticus]